MPTALRSITVSLLLAAAPSLCAQTPPPAPTAEQLKSALAIRQERVDLLRDEIKQLDSRIESRLDMLIDTLKSISDSQNSRSRVAKMKEDTGKKLMNTIRYYDQKRAALKEELRNPRLRLTEEEKRKMIAKFDERIEKRTRQILELNKSMPASRDMDPGWVRDDNYNQNRRMESHNNTQRDALVKQLDAGIARLDRQARTIRTQSDATTDPVQRKALNDELAKTEVLIAERRQQKLETLKPSSTPTRAIVLKEAVDLDKALQTAITDLRRDFNTMFQRYNTILTELSNLHATEAALAAAQHRG